MREIAIKSIIAFLLLAARVASAQGTTTFLSNIGQSSSGSQTVGSDSWLAAVFQTGTSAAGYMLDSIQLGMANSTGSPNDFIVMVYNNGSFPVGTSPGSSLGTFMGSLDPAASGTYTYNAPGSLVLSPLSTYFIIVSADTPIATGAYQWSYAGATSYNPNDDWATRGIQQSSTGGSSWSVAPYEPFQFALIGSVAPEPGVVGLLVMGGLGMMWWTKRARGARLGARGEKV